MDSSVPLTHYDPSIKSLRIDLFSKETQNPFQSWPLPRDPISSAHKGRFTRYDFVAYDKLTTGLRHELFRVNHTYNSLNGPKSCRRPVVSLSYATKSYRENRP